MERHISETLAQLGKKMGFSDLATNANGMVHLSMVGVGELFVDVQASGIFVYLLNQFPAVNFKLISTAYIFCEEKAKHSLPTNPVLHGEDVLGFAIRIEERQFTSMVLGEAVDQLIDMVRRLKQFADLHG
jgi:type III secretion system chaperone SycN